MKKDLRLICHVLFQCHSHTYLHIYATAKFQATLLARAVADLIEHNIFRIIK